MNLAFLKNKKNIFVLLAAVVVVFFLLNHFKGEEAIQNQVSSRQEETKTKTQEDGAPKTLKIGYITDSHCYGKWKKDGSWETNWRCVKPMKAFIGKMNSYFNPDIVMQGGDLSDGRDDETPKILGIAKDMLGELDSPVYHVVGNHEARDIKKEQWLELFGYKRTFYTFDVKGYRIIVLDGNFAPTNRASKNTNSLEDIGPEVEDFYPGIVTTEQISWVKEVLRTSQEKKVLVFIHQPIVDRTIVKERTKLLMNGELLREMFSENGVLAVFSGHIEETCYIEEGGVKYYTIQGFHKGNKAIEGTKDEPVFAEISLENEDLEVRMYQSEDRGETYNPSIIDAGSVTCNNDSIEKLKQEIEE